MVKSDHRIQVFVSNDEYSRILMLAVGRGTSISDQTRSLIQGGLRIIDGAKGL